MDNRTSRWRLLGTSMNQQGVTHFTLSCRGCSTPDGDYEELMRVFKREFGAVEAGQLLGPYSVHKYLEVEELRIGLILDSPDWLDLYATDESKLPTMESFIRRLLYVLNSE